MASSLISQLGSFLLSLIWFATGPASGRPYVMTRFINENGSPFQKILGWHRLTNAPETDIVPELQEFVPGAVAVIDKPIYSLFTSEGRGLVLARGWSSLVMVGIATESCVLKTAVDAFESGITPWIIEDASYSHAGEEAHQAGLLVARRFIGANQVVSSADARSLNIRRSAS
jgi:nicotinamidase-related amidase